MKQQHQLVQVLRRLEMDLLGSLRPIRVDHTKFSKWQLNNNTNSSKSWEDLTFLSSPFLKFPESFRLQKTKNGMSGLIQVSRDLRWLMKKIRPHPSLPRKWLMKKNRPHPSLERLENDVPKKQTSSKSRETWKWRIKKTDLIQVSRDLKMTYQKNQTSPKSRETWKWRIKKTRPHPSLERLENDL